MEHNRYQGLKQCIAFFDEVAALLETNGLVPSEQHNTPDFKWDIGRCWFTNTNQVNATITFDARLLLEVSDNENHRVVLTLECKCTHKQYVTDALIISYFPGVWGILLRTSGEGGQRIPFFADFLEGLHLSPKEANGVHHDRAIEVIRAMSDLYKNAMRLADRQY